MPILTSKADGAYREIRHQVLDGTLAPGARVNQYELADAMGISITPLREAMRRLTGEGWIVQDAHRNARVAELDLDEARHLNETRRVLEPAAVALAAQRRTDDDVAAIEAAVAELRPVTSEEGESALAAHSELHRSLYRAAHNPVMEGLLDGLWDRLERYRRSGLEAGAQAGPRTRDHEEHLELARLVIAGDGEAAAALMTEHIDRSLAAEVAASAERTTDATVGRARSEEGEGGSQG
ncbi:GntR family transcriptional regulator [Actinomyces radicidentis]|uniref:GntR family transcriptional regulator n=1 Tax=Actinomyces radicidentis TaxID=111015 RepID=UPI0009FFC426|nr:GntR family transcriptional regulator [Actinomyces radicidentis]